MLGETLPVLTHPGKYGGIGLPTMQLAPVANTQGSATLWRG
jgi:hypothetical protein